jgi:hypothetical protein
MGRQFDSDADDIDFLEAGGASCPSWVWRLNNRLWKGAATSNDYIRRTLMIDSQQFKLKPFGSSSNRDHRMANLTKSSTDNFHTGGLHLAHPRPPSRQSLFHAPHEVLSCYEITRF